MMRSSFRNALLVSVFGALLAATGAAAASAADKDTSHYLKEPAFTLRDAKNQDTCLTAGGFSDTTGWQSVNFSTCGSYTSRAWKLDEDGRLINERWGRCLTYFSNINLVGMADCASGDSSEKQLWSISSFTHYPLHSSVSGNNLTIKNKESGLYLKRDGRGKPILNASLSTNDWSDFWAAGSR
ncbi:ricin-type beta-trefoil lectin domain protein [Streptomyces erythrochromogenes]|uniref:ricin-type beta-trefoil lectin domain protein n=1 Tax=Streptomyces erythrochromogenes TaxID=285574 RepID=UPI0036AF1CEF